MLGDTDKDTGTIVFILGAGCSADCGAPVMQNFMRTAREYERNMPSGKLKNDYRAMFRFREECMKISYVFDRWWDNIEDLFTQAHLKQLIGDNGGRKLCEQMAWAIWDVYRRPKDSSGSVGYYNFSDYLYWLASKWRITHATTRAPRPVVVTTNYDLHLEASILREHDGCSLGGSDFVEQGLGNVAYPGFRKGALGERFVTLDEARKNDAIVPIELIKLHGSANWFRFGKGVACATRVEHDGSNNAAEFSCQDHSKQARNMTPLIVPPLLGKSDLSLTIKEQWKRVVEALRWARLIVIIGYSFPETDTFMTRLLARGILRNEGLERFIIINKNDTSKWRRRVSRMFAPSWSRNSVDWGVRIRAKIK